MSSPYKKLRTANQEWIGYINLSKLDPGKPYKVLGIQETSHATYGTGQQATIAASNGKKFRAQLPGKYLARLSKDDIDTIKRDAVYGRNPYLVFREIMVDNSYRIDIIEKSADMDDKFLKNEFISELEECLTDEENKDEKRDDKKDEKKDDDTENEDGQNK